MKPWEKKYESKGKPWENDYTETIKTPDMGPSGMAEALQRTGEAVDLPASLLRAGAYGALDENTSASEEVGKQLDRMKTPSKMQEGPSGRDIMQAAGVENETAQKVGGFATEMVLDPLQALPVGKMMKPIARAIKGKAAKSASRVLGDYVTSAQYAKEGIDPKVLAKRLVEEDLVRYINNPEKLLEKIQGSSKVETGIELATGKKSLKRVKNKDGLISEISDDLASHIDDVSARSTEIRTKQIANPVTMNFADNMMDPLSGEALDMNKIQAAEDYVRSIVGKNITKKTMSLKELYELKKNLGKNIASKEFWKNADENITFKKELAVSVIRKIDDTIKSALAGKKIKVDGKILDAADYYSVQNNRMSNLINIRGVMNTVPLKELKKVNMTQMVGESLAAGSAMGMGTGSFGAGAATSAAWAARTRGKDAADAIVAKGIDTLGNFSKQGPRLAPQAIRETRDEPISVNTPYAERLMMEKKNRAPQGSFNAMPASERISLNMPKELMKTKIPRTSEGLKEYSQLFKLKIAQEADNIVRDRMIKGGIDPESQDPMAIQRAATEIYKNVNTVIEEHPDELPTMLPVWIDQYPSMFEKDRYNRIDGVVPNSMQPLVREEIRKNPHISNVDRISQLDLLNRSGEYTDPMPQSMPQGLNRRNLA